MESDDSFRPFHLFGSSIGFRFMYVFTIIKPASLGRRLDHPRRPEFPRPFDHRCACLYGDPCKYEIFGSVS